jgi:integrase/recombinase XerD
MKKPTIKLFHDTRRAKADDTYPVKLYVYYDKKDKFYPLHIDLTKEDYELALSDKPPKPLRNTASRILAVLADAQRVGLETYPFGFELFERELFGLSGDKRDVFAAFEQYIKELKEGDRYSYASTFEDTKSTLKSFQENIEFADITPNWLFELEKHQLAKGNKISTVGLHARNIRVIYNIAIDKNIIHRDAYPFGKRKYEIPSAKKSKRKLSKQEIEKFYAAEVKSQQEEKARDFWFLIYLCYGINMADLLLLKRKQVGRERLSFVRKKTERSKRTEKSEINVLLNRDIIRLLQKWGKIDGNQEDYVFDVISMADDAERVRKLTLQFTKLQNKYLKRIGERLGIKDLTTYTARHSFANMLKNSGAKTEMIGEMLGHASSRTTQIYLDDFEDEVKKEYTKGLMFFKKED